MSLQEIWQIKAEKSKLTKDMTIAQLKEYYDNVLREFSKIIDNQVAKN
ncbi:MAG: hypothetical protein FWF85_04340 [Clostridiales bacterium]|jgi:hypothetical protein|nr:hypothetical protein [Clostridiales bacterium]